MRMVSPNYTACLAAVRWASETATLEPSPRVLLCVPWREFTAPHAEYCLDANPWLTVKTLHLHVVADTLPGVHPCVIRPA
jgi:hypothetical protein